MAVAATRRDILWGYIAQALNLSAGLILLPVILHYLSPEDVGLWFVFISLASLAQLLEFGFQPTLARNTAYVYAGVQSISSEGLPPIPDMREPLNLQLLADLIAASRTIYRIVAALVAVVLLGGGTLYIETLLLPWQSRQDITIGWIAFAVGYIINFYYSYFSAFLQGRGDITSANKIVVLTRTTLIFFGSISVVLGWGLIGLGIASMLSCVAGRIQARNFFYSRDRSEMSVLRSLKGNPNLLASKLWKNSNRLGVVQIGAFLILRANTLIASSFLGLAIAGSYALTITILTTLAGIAAVYCQVQLPQMNAFQSLHNKNRLREIFGSIVIVSWATFFIFIGLAILFADSALTMLGSNTLLLPLTQLVTLAFITVLELNHTLAATYLTTTNHIPFVRAALLSGLGILLLSLSTISHLGVWALIASQGLIQLIYNNWKWPIEAVNHLGGKPVMLLGSGFLEIKRLLFAAPPPIARD